MRVCPSLLHIVLFVVVDVPVLPDGIEYVNLLDWLVDGDRAGRDRYRVWSRPYCSDWWGPIPTDPEGHLPDDAIRRMHEGDARGAVTVPITATRMGSARTT